MHSDAGTDLGIDIDGAVDRIDPYVRRTPVLAPGRGVFGLGFDLTLKLELLQHAGSFKPRGAFNRMLIEHVPDAGIVAASGGNHGVAVAHAASALGHRAIVFLPGVSPAVKRDRVASLGADVRVVGELYDDAQAAADDFAATSGALQIHPYDHPDTVAGQATCGVELREQAPDVDTVLVAAGGGGFPAGIAAAYGDEARIVVVEPQSSCCVHAALAAGEPVEVPVSGVAADSLGARRVGDVPFAVLRRHVNETVLVTDDAIVATREAIWRDVRLVAEPGGATALAALTSGAYTPAADERVAVILCGSNAPPP